MNRKFVLMLLVIFMVLSTATSATASGPPYAGQPDFGLIEFDSYVNYSSPKEKDTVSVFGKKVEVNIENTSNSRIYYEIYNGVLYDHGYIEPWESYNREIENHYYSDPNFWYDEFRLHMECVVGPWGPDWCEATGTIEVIE